MRHAVLGLGGIGGLLAAALARAGRECVVLLRPETLAGYPGRITVESTVLGNFDVEVPATHLLDREIDVLWVATKATQLEHALELAPQTTVGKATVVPLLNGIDHVAVLRGLYPNVVAAAIRVESERLPPAQIHQRSPFLRVELAGAEPPVAVELRDAGIDCQTGRDERTLLWDKLAFLAPIALTTTALDVPLGAARADSRFDDCRDEALAIAGCEGATVDEAALRALQQAAPAEMRSSMQKDVAGGRQPELDAIAGPIIRGGQRHSIPVPATEALAALVASRAVAGAIL